jgi:hypothetical protein
VLGACRDGAWCIEIRALETLDHRRTETRTEVGVFTQRLRDPTPARVPGDIDHRSKGPVDTVGGSFGRTNRSAAAYELRIPARGLPEGNGEYGLEAVDDVPSDKQRDAKATFLDGKALQFVDDPQIDLIEHRTDFALAYELGEMLRHMSAAALELTHLADFFVQAHGRQ